MGRPSRTVQLICALCFTAFVTELGHTSSADKDETSELKVEENHEDPISTPDAENSPGFMGMTDDPEPQPKLLFKTAEIADAVMSTTVPSDATIEAIESLIPPKHVKDPADFHVPCEEGKKCDRMDFNSVVAAVNDLPAEEMEPFILGMIRADAAAEEQNSTESTKTYKVSCDKRNVTGIDNFAVTILNASQDLMDFLNPNSTECSLVLFYTTWCQFSANLAPHFNALPRAFPSMHFLALDASQHSSLSTRFGTVAVPNILLFQGVKPMVRFNQTVRTMETLTSFITNQTGFEAGPDRNVTEEDGVGPLPSVPVRSIDWLLVSSVLFISGFAVYAAMRTDSIRWLIPGQEHDHQD